MQYPSLLDCKSRPGYFVQLMPYSRIYCTFSKNDILLMWADIIIKYLSKYLFYFLGKISQIYLLGGN